MNAITRFFHRHEAQDLILNRRLRDRYEALSTAWPPRCWSAFGLVEPGALVAANPGFMAEQPEPSGHAADCDIRLHPHDLARASEDVCSCGFESAE